MWCKVTFDLKPPVNIHVFKIKFIPVLNQVQCHEDVWRLEV
jgi:hypothetical protein